MKKFRFLIFMLIITSIFIGCAQPTDDSVIPEVPETTVSDAYPSWEDDFKEGQEFEYTKYFKVVENDKWHDLASTRYFIWLNDDYSFIYTKNDAKFVVTDKRISVYGADTELKLTKDDVKSILEILIKQNMLTPKAK